MLFTRALPILLAPLGGLWMALSVENALAEGDLAGTIERSHHASFSAFLESHCLDCHGDTTQKADLNLAQLFTENGPQVEDRRQWAVVLDMVAHGEMPPEKKPRPSAEEKELATVFLRETLRRFNTSSPVNPGRVTSRRLNRVEYQNTIRDLVGVTFEATEAFPRDEVGYGFDHIGDVLTLSSLLMEKYLDAAEVIVDEALLSELPAWPPVRRFEETQMTRSEGDGEHVRIVNGRYLGFYREGEGTVRLEVEEPGEYRLRIRAYQDRAGPEPAVLAVDVGGQRLREVEVTAEGNAPEIYELLASLEKGEVEVILAFTNNYNNQDAPDRRLRGDRNVFVDYLELVGPVNGARPPLPETHRQVIPREPEPGEESALAREVFEAFTSRAYRRPAREEEVERLVQLAQVVWDDGGTFEEGIKVGVQAVLVSPHFLFRWELDEAERDREIRELNGYELASRLSYFFWSSMPDETLFKRAADGSLTEPEVLAAEAERLLQDPKAEALVRNFAGQWLQTRNLAEVQPDPETFPDFDEALREAMATETVLFVADIIDRDASVLELIDADFTYLNERLAAHYGIEGVEGENFRKVALPAATPRGGLLTQASILTITSNPTRTSPVNRGKWVLEQILGTPPPPPPPDVQPLPEGKQASEMASLRERLEQHRANPECAGCHAKMDPIGFALENYDAIGRWRELDGSFVIDASAELAGGIKVNGPVELKRALKEKEDFVISLTDKLLTYALGRGTEYYDDRAIHQIAEGLKEEDYRFAALLRAIVLSDPFRKRKLNPDTTSSS